MSENDGGAPALGQRQTRQRDRIFQVIRDAQGPLTVQAIHERAQREIPALGIATVYRTINLLQETGQVRIVILPTGETRYEMSDLGHHHHFQCRVCEEVYDFDRCPVALPEGSTLGTGFTIERHELTLFGVCAACEAAA